ncbi:hypothetical protein B0H63DRAFT_314724 [Podospora didyma]|uniref:Uncharacterized protein n=1 Tax=Podospora didyma TaxID=330526 RepID=A0AAE0N4V6_9PEZI|nr:hypothetical protein B0H63DRAFT_314724 [Podospora didyma]
MTSITSHEMDKQGLTVETTMTRLTEQPSQDPFGSDTYTPLAEKHTRSSDVSTPGSSRANPFDTDIEAIITASEHNTRKSAECTKGGSDCQVWPGKDHWRQKAKAAKRNRHSCNCLSRLSKRNRIIVKILIGLLIVGIALGVGLGVSRHLNAPIWRSETQN